MLGVIGGSGFERMPDIEIVRREIVRTPFGEPSCPLSIGRLAGQEFVFLARHGYAHRLAAHEINYRANIWALAELRVSSVIALSSVGGIHEQFSPGSLVVPQQILDYTHGREHTFFEGLDAPAVHIDFTQPYDEALRQTILSAGKLAQIDLFDFGVYATTQGPRLETAAEVQKIQRDGGDLIGMTGMPEAVLAREKSIAYACLAVVANWAAGLGGGKERIDFQAADAAFKNSVLQTQTILHTCLSQKSV